MVRYHNFCKTIHFSLERVMHFAHDPAILAGWQGSLIPVT
jgi:hypothetical protein